jgi:hypothetical protein
VYIDVDDVYVTGPYGRYICLVYIDYNSTHLLNVNLAMVLNGKATITDYDNQWNPYTWTLHVTVATLNWAANRAWRELNQLLTRKT